LPLAASLAERNHSVLHLAVVHPWGSPEDAPRPGSRADEEVRELEGTYLNRLTQTVAATYRIPVCEAVLDGNTASGALVDYARRARADLVIASTHEHGSWWRWISSGVARQLAHRLRASVLFIKPQLGSLPTGQSGFRRILVALDGSSLAEAGLEQALALASADAVVTLVQVVSRSEPDAEQRRSAAQSYLDSLAAGAKPLGCRWEGAVLEGGKPAQALVSYAEITGMDLIVLTTRDRVPLPRAIIGTVADHVLHRSSLPVLVCHTAGVPAQAGSGEGS
jgi:nucleotide-binding universal stress UspA family protein